VDKGIHKKKRGGWVLGLRLTLMYADTNLRTLNGSRKADRPLKKVKMMQAAMP
jgi:hypothetical protein